MVFEETSEGETHLDPVSELTERLVRDICTIRKGVMIKSKLRARLKEIIAVSIDMEYEKIRQEIDEDQKKFLQGFAYVAPKK